MTRKNILSFIILLTFLFSCSDDEKGNKTHESNIQGKVEKGPFVKGSTIEIQELNESLSPTGRTFSTTIIDDEGNFSLNNVTLESQYVLLNAEGYFFNEIDGNLSKEQINLQALSDLSDGTSININILTHLKKERLMQLVKQDKLPYKEANSEAQNELLASFGLQKYANKDVSTYSISAGTNESGALIAVSATLLNGRSESQLTEYITNLSNDFKIDGRLSDEHKEDIWKNSTELNTTTIKNNIIERYKSFNKDINVPDLSYFIDWNKDGIAGNEFGEGQKELNFETDTLKVDSKGGKFKVKVNAQVQYKFFKEMVITSPSFADIGIRTPVFEKSLTDDNYLELTIEPASSILMETAHVIICSMDEQIMATLYITQEGDYNKEFPNKEVEDMYSSNLKEIRNSSSINYLMEAFYSQSFNNYANSSWESFYNHELNSSNSTIYTGWAQAYKPLGFIRLLKQRSKELNIELTWSAFENLEAMVYYQLAILWGNAAYVKGTGMDIEITQMPEKDLFLLFEDPLLRCIELFPAKKNNNRIYVSKDTPRAVLAKMYAQIGEYSKALLLLNDIISNGDYEIESSREKACSNNSRELIYSFEQDKYGEYSNLILNCDRLPVITYTEVLLLAAECEIKSGNKSKATEYLNIVRNKRGKESVTTATIENDLTTIWEDELKGFFSYFAYLKRNNLAESKLNIDAFQMIFPIPYQDIALSPLKQNPGYTTK